MLKLLQEQINQEKVSNLIQAMKEALDISNVRVLY